MMITIDESEIDVEKAKIEKEMRSVLDEMERLKEIIRAASEAEQKLKKNREVLKDLATEFINIKEEVN